jgi:pimeloyl-ACP methyl ester carboxylesterase
MKAQSLIAAVLSVSALHSLPARAAGEAAEKPSVVIVHGAFADGSDWAKVIPLLQAKGLKVTAVQNSLDSLASDVATTKRVIASQPGKVVLVGHSWGGMVISEAGQDDKVAALVFVAALVPEVGQSAAELTKDHPTEGLKSVVADQGGYLSLSAEGLAHFFAQDLPAKQTAVMSATQGPINSKAFGEKTTVAAWSSRPSWYIVAEKDLMIDPAQEKQLAEKIGAKVTALPSSHVPQQSRPAEVAKVILEAVKAAEKGAEKAPAK